MGLYMNIASEKCCDMMNSFKGNESYMELPEIQSIIRHLHLSNLNKIWMYNSLYLLQALLVLIYIPTRFTFFKFLVIILSLFFILILRERFVNQREFNFFTMIELCASVMVLINSVFETDLSRTVMVVLVFVKALHTMRINY